MEAFTKVGLDALLTPNNCLLVLIRRTQISSPILLISNATRDIQELARCHQEIAALRPEAVPCSGSMYVKVAEPEELQICA